MKEYEPLIENSEEQIVKEEVLNLSRSLVDSYVSRGIDKMVVISTLRDFAQTSHLANEGDEQGIKNFKRLQDNPHFYEFLGSDFLKDVTSALGFHNFPASEKSQKSLVFKLSAEAFDSLTEEEV